MYQINIIQEFTIQTSHFPKALFTLCGCPESKFNLICLSHINVLLHEVEILPAGPKTTVKIMRKHSCIITASFSGGGDDGTSDRGNTVFDKMETLNRKSVTAEAFSFYRQQTVSALPDVEWHHRALQVCVRHISHDRGRAAEPWVCAA